MATRIQPMYYNGTIYQELYSYNYIQDTGNIILTNQSTSKEYITAYLPTIPSFFIALHSNSTVYGNNTQVRILFPEKNFGLITGTTVNYRDLSNYMYFYNFPDSSSRQRTGMYYSYTIPSSLNTTNKLLTFYMGFGISNIDFTNFNSIDGSGVGSIKFICFN